jgi:hypothetical protein
MQAKNTRDMEDSKKNIDEQKAEIKAMDNKLEEQLQLFENKIKKVSTKCDDNAVGAGGGPSKA